MSLWLKTPQNWDRVVQELPGRTKQQCKDRWRRLNKPPPAGRWSAAEVRMVVLDLHPSNTPHLGFALARCGCQAWCRGESLLFDTSSLTLGRRGKLLLTMLLAVRATPA